MCLGLKILIFIFGIIIGSFLNVCIWRIPRGESVVFPSSHCVNCSKELRAYHLLPIISYILMGGKCRYCGSHISLQYPFIELLNGIIYLFIFNNYGLSLAMATYCILASLLVVISFIDLQHKIIPDSLVLTGFLFVVLLNILDYIKTPYLLVSGLLGLLLGSGFFLILAIITKGGMGGGDIKLISLLGFWLGWKWTLLMMLLSFTLGGIISVLLVVLKVKGRKDTIPFAPFIATATLLTVLYGNDIINYYTNILLNGF